MKSSERVGLKYGRLTTIKFCGTNDSGKRMFLFRCECGNEKMLDGGNVFSGGANSCGCLRKEMFSKPPYTSHGKSTSRIYVIWCGMVKRCTNPKTKNYGKYGGRGITVCSRWLQFENFLADMGEPTEGQSIERIDNDGNYEPSNCRWATKTEQNRNTSRTIRLTFQGQTMPLRDWAEQVGIPHSAISQRIAAGWSVDRALTVPVQRKKTINKDNARLML